MKTSEQIDAISAALAKAQGEIANPTKGSENPHFRSHYADLSAGINAVRDCLSANGIAYVQATRLDGGVLMLDTRLAHSGGQWIESEFPVCSFPEKPQIVGSALTYARRYALFALAGIAGEDDDGNAANAAETPVRQRQTPPKPPEMPAEELKARMLGAIQAAKTPAELEKLSARVAENETRLPEADFKSVTDALAWRKETLEGLTQ